MTTLTAKQLAYLLFKMGERKVYVSIDDAGSSYGTLVRASITFNEDSVIIFPAIMNLDYPSRYDDLNIIGEMKGE